MRSIISANMKGESETWMLVVIERKAFKNLLSRSIKQGKQGWGNS